MPKRHSSFAPRAPSKPNGGHLHTRQHPSTLRHVPPASARFSKASATEKAREDCISFLARRLSPWGGRIASASALMGSQQAAANYVRTTRERGAPDLQFDQSTDLLWNSSRTRCAPAREMMDFAAECYLEALRDDIDLPTLRQAFDRAQRSAVNPGPPTPQEVRAALDEIRKDRERREDLGVTSTSKELARPPRSPEMLQRWSELLVELRRHASNDLI